MDLFKFIPASSADATILTNGEPIVGTTSVTWVERYRDPGEFEITGFVSSGLKSALPLGTLISHVKTADVMMVENHEIIEEEPGADAVIKISGRSLEAFLDHRVVGMYQNWTTQAATLPEYILSSATTWTQASVLINDHIYTVAASDTFSALSNLVANTAVSESGVATPRTIKRGNLHTRLVELLNIDDTGIRVIRVGRFVTGVSASTTDTRFIIHKGNDKTASVLFSVDAGDISSAQYFWSNRLEKNAALVTGRYVETFVPGTSTKYNRRIMFVDASDIDGSLPDTPIGTTLTDIRAKMAVRGAMALKAQKSVALVSAEVSSTSGYQYRVDYDIGDVVMVAGNYGEMAKMRVVEFVEIEDENGESGHPTLSVMS